MSRFGLPSLMTNAARLFKVAHWNDLYVIGLDRLQKE